MLDNEKTGLWRWYQKEFGILLALAMVFAIAFRVVGTIDKKTFSHDESISYLAATCHEGQYSSDTDALAQYGTWVSASSWKKFIQPERFFCFKQIGLDLAYFDIHPPLYFWILHLWISIFGTSTWAGPSLNIVFVLATICFLFYFARGILGNPEEAGAVVLTWAVSPAIISISLEARQYDLLALASLIFVWLIMKCARLTELFSLRDAVLLTILTTCGSLVHFSFSLVMIGSCIFLIAKLVKKNPVRLFSAFTSIVVGLLVFVSLHPKFYESIILQKGYLGETLTFAGLVGRMKHVAVSFIDFFLPWHSLILLVGFALLFLILGMWVKSLYVRQVDKPLHIFEVFGGTGLDILFFFIWISGTTTILYLAFLSPAHAMGSKYLSMAWPFFGFIPVFFLRNLGDKRRLLTFLFCSGMLMSGTASVIHTVYQNNTADGWTKILENSDKIIIDNDARGVLMPIVWQIPDDSFVFVAAQNYLLDNQDMWTDQLDDSIYVSVSLYGNSIEKRQEILSVIDQNRRSAKKVGEISKVGEVFLVEPMVR